MPEVATAVTVAFGALVSSALGPLAAQEWLGYGQDTGDCQLLLLTLEFSVSAAGCLD